MKKLKIFPKMFIQIFSVLGIIIILVHSLVFFIFPKTYLETRKEKIHNMANEISSNMNGKEIKYIEQTLELYSKSSEIKAFIKEKNNKNAIQIKDNINVSLESDSNSLIIEEREITLNKVTGPLISTIFWMNTGSTEIKPSMLHAEEVKVKKRRKTVCC